MPRVCTVCSHPDRAAIDRALVAGEASFRTIADRFGLSETALKRHKGTHLPATLVQAHAAQETAAAVDVMTELTRCFARMNLLLDACDRWLRDPAQPDRYDIGPRAEELDVTYEETIADRNGNARRVRRKKRLSELLAEIEGAGRSIVLVETRHADPRELVIKTARQLQGQIELVARLMGELEDGSTVNIVVSPAWTRIRDELLAALRPFPEAAQAVAGRLQLIEGGAGHAAD